MDPIKIKEEENIVETNKSELKFVKFLLRYSYPTTCNKPIINPKINKNKLCLLENLKFFCFIQQPIKKKGKPTNHKFLLKIKLKVFPKKTE